LHNHAQPNARHNAQAEGAQQLIIALHVALKVVDGKQRWIGLQLGVVHEKHVDQLLHAHVLADDVFNHIGIET